MTVGASAAYRTEQERIAQALRNGQPLTQQQLDDLHKTAQAYGAVTQAAAELKAQNDANFSIMMVFLSELKEPPEYDAAQERGEAATDGRPNTVPDGNGIVATAADLGLSRKTIHDARIREAA